MAPPRKHPTKDAAEVIQRLAASGYAIIGIAKHFNVARETFARWLNEHSTLNEAFDSGREIERQRLHAAVYQSAMEGKPANVNAFFLLKARHGYVEADQRSVNVGVSVEVTPVMVVTDHGTDAEWQAKATEQQKRLALNAATPVQLEASLAPQQLIVPETDHEPTAPQQYEVPCWRPNA
jgi:transposase-like protein